jgi:RNA polymerase sigma factor (sigma-70 family)
MLRQRFFRLGGGWAVPDRQLLERFAARHDEEAFAELVRRHGPMVLRVCQRTLRHAEDAEDAFQATFIVLGRKAASVAQPDLLANWLYGIAQRVAAKARSGAARRCARELPSIAHEYDFRSDREPRNEEDDWRPVLDEELNRLPDRFRAPLVLCYLQGKTSGQAAVALRCSVRTITSRLSRGRDLLRNRLARRGLALSGTALGALLARESAVAAVPSKLAAAAIRVAVLAAAGNAFSGAAVPTTAGLLAAAMLKGMTIAKIRLVAAVLLGALVLGGGTALVVSASRPGPTLAQGGSFALGASTDATTEDQLNPRPGATTVKFLGLQQLPDGIPLDFVMRAGKTPPNGKWAVWSCSLDTWREDTRTYPFTMQPTTATATVYFGLGEISGTYPTQADVHWFATVYSRYLASVCLVDITNQRRYLASRNGRSSPPPIVVSLPGVLTNGNWAGGPEW